MSPVEAMGITVSFYHAALDMVISDGCEVIGDGSRGFVFFFQGQTENLCLNSEFHQAKVLILTVSLFSFEDKVALEFFLSCCSSFLHSSFLQLQNVLTEKTRVI